MTGEGSSDDDCGDDDDDDEDRGGYDGSLRPSHHLRLHIDDPQVTPTPELPFHIISPKIDEDPKSERIQTNSSQEARREEGQLNEVSETPDASQQEPFALAQESRLVPTTSYYQAIEKLDRSDLIALINELLKQNSARFDDFLAQRQAYVPTTFTPKRAKPGSPFKTTFSHAWNNQVERNLLTEAIDRSDKLLARFRAAIFDEDTTNLKPRIEQAVLEFEATGVPSKVHNRKPLTIADQDCAAIHRLCYQDQGF